jgi:hypothetical protein
MLFVTIGALLVGVAAIFRLFGIDGNNVLYLTKFSTAFFLPIVGGVVVIIQTIVYLKINLPTTYTGFFWDVFKENLGRVLSSAAKAILVALVFTLTIYYPLRVLVNYSASTQKQFSGKIEFLRAAAGRTGGCAEVAGMIVDMNHYELCVRARYSSKGVRVFGQLAPGAWVTMYGRQGLFGVVIDELRVAQ